jgi:hypothetical protein
VNDSDTNICVSFACLKIDVNGIIFDGFLYITALQQTSRHIISKLETKSRQAVFAALKVDFKRLNVWQCTV